MNPKGIECESRDLDFRTNSSDYRNLIEALLEEGITPFVTRELPKKIVLSFKSIIGISPKYSKSDMAGGETRRRFYWTLSDTQVSALRRLEIWFKIGKQKAKQLLMMTGSRSTSRTWSPYLVGTMAIARPADPVTEISVTRATQVPSLGCG